MKEPQEVLDYRRIANALAYIEKESLNRPSLDEIARETGMSAYHFQRTFTRWSGISPNRFLQAVTLERARQALLESKPTLETAIETGLTGTGRLYDLFMTLEGVPPGSYRSRGSKLDIRYGVASSPFGFCFAALTDDGVCRMDFSDIDSAAVPLARLKSDWPEARYFESKTSVREIVDTVFRRKEGRLRIVAEGTNFQIQVWKALLGIPVGTVTTYSEVAAAIDRPTAVRAVGNAVGSNPVAYLIPCHRVIRKLGAVGGYRWGTIRKRVILGRELAG